MKYLLLIYSQENAWPPEEHQVALAESIDLSIVLVSPARVRVAGGHARDRTGGGASSAHR
jgi:hypothetical protein